MAQFGSKSNGKIFCVWRVRIVRSDEFGVWSGGIAFCDDCIKGNIVNQFVGRGHDPADPVSFSEAYDEWCPVG